MSNLSGGVRQVSPNTPLTWVVVEVRFAGGRALPSPSIQTLQALRDGLGDGWILEGAAEPQAESEPFISSSTSVHADESHRVVMRDRSRAVTVRAGSLTIETTNYVNFLDFQEFLGEAMRAVEAVVSPDGVARVGMRYVDEIVVGPEEDVDWSAWMPSVLMPPAATSLVPTQWLSVIEYDIDDEHHLVLRHGPTSEGALGLDGPLRSPRPRPDGPIYTWDFDSSWQPADISAFETDTLLSECDRLRTTVRTLFEELETPQLIAIWRRSDDD